MAKGKGTQQGYALLLDDGCGNGLKRSGDIYVTEDEAVEAAQQLAVQNAGDMNDRGATGLVVRAVQVHAVHPNFG
jgi:hypothetical protein